MSNCSECSKVIADRNRHKTCSAACSKARDLRRKKLWRERNVEYCAKYSKQYRLDNLEKCKAASRVSRDKYMKSIADRPDKRVMLLVRTCRSSAQQRGLDFDLLPEVIHAMIKVQDEKCALTGIPFDWGFGGDFRANPFAPSVDRKDARKGYTYDNIQIVCYAVNLAKNEYPVEVFDSVCRARVEMLSRA